MNSTLKISLMTAVAFVVAAGIVQNFRHQWEMEHQINDLKKQVSQAPAAQNPQPLPPASKEIATSAAVAPLLIESDPVDYVKNHQNILQIMDVGWKLINRRSPASAQQAAAIFQEGLEKVDKTSPDLYNGLGRALLIAGKPHEALVAWQNGLTYAPKFADMQSGIGWAYWHLNDPYHAKEAWEAAVLIDPKCVDAWSALAWIDMALGNKERSVIGFQVLVAYDGRRQVWNTGLTMARAGNRDLKQITSVFPLPPLEAFSRPPVPEPSSMSATVP